MNSRAVYSLVCAAFAASVLAGSLAGCFSEHAAAAPIDGAELCQGLQRPNVVRMSNYSFVPTQLSVSAGTEVIWVNCDPDQHTSTSDTNLWNSDLIPPNGTFRRVFNQTGTFPFHCIPHSNMQARIVVS